MQDINKLENILSLVKAHKVLLKKYFKAYEEFLGSYVFFSIKRLIFYSCKCLILKSTIYKKEREISRFFNGLSQINIKIKDLDELTKIEELIKSIENELREKFL